MKKAIVLFALFLMVAGWVTMEAQQPKPVTGVQLPPSAKPLPPGVKPGPAPSSTPSGPPVDNSRPEPSALYGYVTVIDPTSNQRYIGDPNATPSQRGSGLSFPMHVVFRRTMDSSQTFTRDWPTGTSYYRNPPVAVWYSIPLMTDSTAGDYPVVNYRDNKLHYDPAKWRFLRLEMGPVGWQEMSDTGVTTNVSVPVRPVAQLGDLPDFNGSLSGPAR